MQAGIMITNGGPHPSDKWAEHSAKQITDLIQIDADADTPEAKAARLAKPRLLLDLQEALDVHHDDVQKHERGKIVEHGFDRLSHPLTPESSHLDDAVATVAEKTVGTPFEAHFANPEVQAIVRRIIGGHFATSMDIDRSRHADANMHHEHAQAYRKARADNGAAHVHAHIHKYRSGGAGKDK